MINGSSRFAAALVMSLACGTTVAQPAPAPETSGKPSIRLTNVIVALPVGTAWLSFGDDYYCYYPKTEIWTAGRAPQALPPYAAAFKAELTHAGYKVITPGEDNLFDPETGAADYEAAAVITDEKINACASNTRVMFTDIKPGDVKGDGEMKIDWQIYSPIKKQIVAQVSTGGFTKLDKFVTGGFPKLIMDSFTANVQQLAAAPDFQAAMNAPRPLVAGVVLPGQQDKIALSGSLKAKGRPVADAVGSVVSLITGDGAGSGVLVSDDGYILTNAHVVGDEKSIRVRWSDRLETVADVVRVAKDRDVALVKTNARDRAPFPLKRGAVTQGQKVYAIGSPKGPTFQGTVTSGIVSADRIVNGLRYIQSDVTVSFGSSGGALLNEKGELIGLTDLGVPNAGQPAGLNLFIPIGDALDFLSLEQK